MAMKFKTKGRLPVPVGPLEVAARAHARDFIAASKQGDFIGLGYAPLDPRCGRAFLHAMLRDYALSNQFLMSDVIELAKAGWEEADLVLRGLIEEFSRRSELPPPTLAAYCNWLIDPRRVPVRREGRRSKVDNFMQDLVIVRLIMDLIAEFDLKPYRSQVGRMERPSACSIAAAALAEAGLHRGGENAIRMIWKRYAPSITTGWLRGKSLQTSLAPIT